MALVRQGSGADIPINVPGASYCLIRSILADNKTGGLNTEGFIKEIFEGFVGPFGDAFFEVYAHPSTIIVDGTTVTMASQIFEIAYTNDLAKYIDVITIKDYYTKRATMPHVSESRSITWLGKPSVVFTYNNRDQLKNFTNDNPGINLIFWITSFNSSRCISDFSTKVKTGEYCDKYELIKRHCNNANLYQIHDTFLDYKNRKLGHAAQPAAVATKFITDFESAITRIRAEAKGLAEYAAAKAAEGSSPVAAEDYSQRYNETFTYFFPWDIDGIEIGLSSPSEINGLKDTLVSERKKVSNAIKNVLLYDPHLIATLNEIISFIKAGDVLKLKEKINGYHVEAKYTYYLVAKFLLMTDCSPGIVVIKDNELDRITGLLNALHPILEEDVKLYEYIQQEDKTYKMVQVDRAKRESKFNLYEQVQRSYARDGDLYLDRGQIQHSVGGGDITIPGKNLTEVYLSVQQFLQDDGRADQGADRGAADRGAADQGAAAQGAAAQGAALGGSRSPKKRTRRKLKRSCLRKTQRRRRR